MSKRLLIILLNLTLIGFSFLRISFADINQTNRGLIIEHLKKDIQKQELNIDALRRRYNNILKQEEELRNFINQETQRIEQLKKEKEARLKEEERRLAEVQAQKVARRLAELEKKKSKKYEYDIDKQEKARIQEELIRKEARRVEIEKKKQLKAKEEERKRRLSELQAEKEAKRLAELKEKEAKRLELEEQKQKSFKSLVTQQQKQRRLKAEKDEEMLLSRKAEERALHNKYVLELEALVKKQKRLFEEGKKLESDILKEEETLRGLESNPIIKQHKELLKK